MLNQPPLAAQIQDAVAFAVTIWILFGFELFRRVAPDSTVFGPGTGGAYRQYRQFQLGGIRWVWQNPFSLGRGMFETSESRPLSTEDPNGSFDLRAAEQKLAAFRRTTTKLGIVVRALALFLTLGVPLAILALGTTYGIIVSATISLGTAGWVAVQYWSLSAHYGRRQGSDRIVGSVSIGIYPISALLAVEELSINLLEESHPVVAAKAVGMTDLEAFIEKHWRAAAFPSLAESERRPDDNHQQLRLEQFAERIKLHWTDWRKPPQRTDTKIRAYCPRCRTMYVVQEGQCLDCQNVALIRFKD